MSREVRIPTEAAAALAKGLRIEAIKLVREANHGVDLRGAMEAVDAFASGKPREIRIPAEAAAVLAKGLRIKAIKLVREANHGVDLRAAMEAVDAFASGKQRFPIDPPAAVAPASFDGLPAEALAALSRGQLIEAIKIVRAATGLGLKEAKDLVERYRDEQAPVRDEAMRAKLEGVARKHGVELPEAALTAMERGDLKAAMNLVRQAKESAPHAAGTARGAHTVSRGTNRYGWLWALLALALLAGGYLLLG